MIGGCSPWHSNRSIKQVVIADSVTSIGISAFDFCSDLTDIYYGGNFVSWDSLRLDTGIENEVNDHYADPVCSGPSGEIFHQRQL